ncbi:hypothetical protein AMELA_G00105650 [Ameiurus melas]|uniref:Uncharacterized protein n=1 Tax=Ameiurus melas TaxID=219545 RepID=A0A7J6ATU4_AMEME|nr:hypothetical protein AMELA_G00105650 [Ameiurus melas]
MRLQGPHNQITLIKISSGAQIIWRVCLLVSRKYSTDIHRPGVLQDIDTASDGVMAVVSDRVGCVAVRALPPDLITLPLLWLLLFRLVDAQGQGKCLCVP